MENPLRFFVCELCGVGENACRISAKVDDPNIRPVSCPFSPKDTPEWREVKNEAVYR